jgi:hypothetical protein
MQQILPIPKYNSTVTNSSIPRECYLAWEFLSDLDRYYPYFEYWFFKKVCPDIATGSRKIILRKSDDKVVAVAILKKHIDEKKICTFRVAEDVQRNGMGTELMLESLEWLESKQPLITVNEENAPEFEGFLRKFYFREPIAVKGLYRPNKKEIIYNAPI